MSQLIFDQKYRIGAWVAERVGMGASWGDFYAMGAEVNGELVAGIVFNGWNGVNATAHIAITKPTRVFLQLLESAADYAFRVGGLKRLTGLVDMSNEKARKLDEHIGFEPECVIKGAAKDGGDIQVYVLWPDKCRWWKTRGAA